MAGARREQEPAELLAFARDIDARRLPGVHAAEIRKGSYNLTIPYLVVSPQAPRSDATELIWRISTPIPETGAEQEQTINEWRAEMKLATIFGAVGMGPKIIEMFDETSNLFHQTRRLITLQRRFHSDLKHVLQKNAGPRIGRAAAEMLLGRCRDLGTFCVVHADIKPENVLACSKYLARGSTLVLTDFDPYVLFLGCNCFNPSVNFVRQGRWIPDFDGFRSALVALLNIIMLWLYFWALLNDKKASESARSPGAFACLDRLAEALAHSKFPLAGKHGVAAHLPPVLQKKLAMWKRIIATRG